MPTTPYMALMLPTVSGTVGPTWASNLNDAMTLVDSHNHTSGQGVQVPTAGININADLSFAGTNATLIRSSRYSTQASTLALPTDVTCLYVSGNNLYYNNGAGTPVQITAGSALAASSLGGISGLAGTSGSVSFNSGTGAYTFLLDANVAGLMDVGAVSIHPVGTSTPSISLVAPAGLGAAYTLTMPAVVPATNALLVMSSSGVLTTLTGSTISGSSLSLAGSLNLGSASTLDVAGQSITFSSAIQALLVTTGSNVPLRLKGNRNASDSNIDVEVQASTNRTNGYLFGVSNNTSSFKHGVTPDGYSYYAGANPSAGTAFNNTVTPTNICKAWGFFNTNGAGGVTLAAGFNISSVFISGSSVRFVLAAPVLDRNATAVFTGSGAVIGRYTLSGQMVVEAQGAVNLWDTQTNTYLDFAAIAFPAFFFVMGAQ